MGGSMEQQTFSSRLTTVFTMVGVAVGVGNVWRFPYMMGQYGGSAFLLIFIFFAVLFAIPAVMGEWALGRATRKGPPGAYIQVLGSKPGKIVGGLMLFTVFMQESYYLLIIAYLTYTTWYSGVHGFSEEQLPGFQVGMDTPLLQYGFVVLLLVMSVLVLLRGLREGIEKVSLWFVPVFGLIVLVLVGYTLSLDGALTHLFNFLKPDFQAMAKPANIFAAMGQAFFSLSLGGTFFVAYGSYLRAEEKIPIPATLTGLGDMGAALLVSLFIVPAMLVFGLEQGQGPSLIFQTLPRLFAVMPAGRLLGTLFLGALVLIAFLSSLAALQVLSGALVEFFGLARKKAIGLVVVGQALVILPIALFPVWIGRLDMIFGSGMQLLGSGLALLALTYGLGRARVIKEIYGDQSGPIPAIGYFWLRVVIPLSLLVVLIIYIWDTIKG